jgi:hypothetical protein
MKKVTRKAYAPSPRIAYREIEGQILVLLPDDTEIYTFNAAGTLIWKGLARRHGQPRIVSDLMRAFGVDRTRAEADVVRFIRDMARKGLLVGAFTRSQAV